ncbi:uncharacterized protein LOC103844803 isoform X2 [Brassica rapa]|uniref:uncharacterized protein LOC103844803 isoform X2 n=1 Tax=Brassica campestris TaxID=3711 RepID=UPI00142D5071|nr:uncharacterized protein LOC103844803 isoform X2 [Brassica rapa]
MPNIRSHRDTTLCLSVLEGLAMLLHNKLVTSGVEPLVMNINLKLVGAGQSYLKGLGVSAENPSDTFLTLGSVAVSKVVHLLLQNMEMSKKIESITVSEPNNYILNSPPQVRTLTSTYDPLLSVSDGPDSAVFVTFNAEMTKLTNICASLVMHVGVEDPHVRALPQGLQDIVGEFNNLELKYLSSLQDWHIFNGNDNPGDVMAGAASLTTHSSHGVYNSVL